MRDATNRSADQQRKQNNLFRRGPNGWLNACVGANGGFAELDRIARGHFAAGQLIVERLRHDRQGLDCLIYPLVQTYRHGIEAMLKHLVLLVSELCDTPGDVRYTHRLIDNWRILRERLIELEVEDVEIEIVEDILIDFIEIDATGEAFRYPTSRTGLRHLEQTTHVNVLVFADGMGAVCDFLENCYCWAVDAIQNKHEMQSFKPL